MSSDWTGTPSAPESQSMASRIRSYITWNLGDLGIGIAGTLILIFLLTGIAAVFASSYSDESPEAYAAQFIATAVWDISFVVLLLFIVRRKKAGPENLGLRDGVTTPGETALWIIGGYVALYSTVVIYNIIVSVLGLDFLEPSKQLESDVFDNNVVIILAGIAIVLCAPIAEEILFRGFLFGGLTRYVPLWAAALLSGGIFSLAHFNVGLVIPFTVVGMLLALLYARTNSLITNISVHMLFNLTSFLVLVFFPDAR